MIMKLKRTGFFAELPHGESSGPSLKASVRDDPQPNEPRIVEYLRCGCMFIAAPGLARDVLNKEDLVIGALRILTDGVWCWPSDLSYYVDKYHVRVPTEFLRRMEEKGWMPPKNVDIQSLEM